MDRIVFWRENCASAPVSFAHVSYSVFGIARDLFYWELIFCVFCYSYSEIGINGIVPKERALRVFPTDQETSFRGFLPWVPSPRPFLHGNRREGHFVVPSRANTWSAARQALEIAWMEFREHIECEGESRLRPKERFPYGLWKTIRGTAFCNSVFFVGLFRF